MRSLLKDLLLSIVVVVVIFLLAVTMLGTWAPWAVVSSFSMEPLLKLGDIVVLQGVNAGEDLLGEIVVYRSSRGAGEIIHRVVGRTEAGFITKGDANPGPDQAFLGEGPVTYERIVGKALVSLPYLGIITLIIKPVSLTAIGLLAWVGKLALFTAIAYVIHLLLERIG